MDFQIDQTDQAARACTLRTSRSVIQTPVFMPVGTVGAVKALDAIDLHKYLDPQIILANTYHLYLRPGDKNVAQLGGLHSFTRFKKSFLTDSGGFQAFSLSQNVKIDDEGILFASHIDGTKHYFTPEKVLDIQYNLGSDIMMILDDLVALPASKERIAQSIARTAAWAKRSVRYHRQNQARGKGLEQNIFAIVQGGSDKASRIASATALCELDFDGYAIGGLSVGEPNEVMYEVVAYTAPLLPSNKPRYLMGVGTPEDLVENVYRGIDMFDCVMPTRNARNGTLFTTRGRLNIKKAAFALDERPIDETCGCYVCQNYTRAYLNHLFRAKELTYFRLATIHNLYYYSDLMKRMREAILQKRFEAFRKAFYQMRKD